MMAIRNSINILKTNWVCLSVTLVAVYLYSIIHAYETGIFTFYQAILSASILVCLYGIVFWVGLIVALIILDVVIVRTAKGQLAGRLLLEWLIICIPAAFWLIRYEHAIFGVGIVALLFAQFLKWRMIKKL